MIQGRHFSRLFVWCGVDDIVDVNSDRPQSVFGVLKYFDDFSSVCVMDCCVVLCECDCGTLEGDVVCGKERTADVRMFKVVGCDVEFSDRVCDGIDRSGALAV